MEQRSLPNATAVLILGILSIPGCCVYGFGIVLGVIALVLAGKDKKQYLENPELYNNYSTLNTGRILAIIGIVLSAIYILIILGVVIFMGGNLEEFQSKMLEMQNM